MTWHLYVHTALAEMPLARRYAVKGPMPAVGEAFPLAFLGEGWWGSVVRTERRRTLLIGEDGHGDLRTVYEPAQAHVEVSYNEPK